RLTRRRDHGRTDESSESSGRSENLESTTEVRESWGSEFWEFRECERWFGEFKGARRFRATDTMEKSSLELSKHTELSKRPELSELSKLSKLLSQRHLFEAARSQVQLFQPRLKIRERVVDRIRLVYDIQLGARYYTPTY